ncbi:GatB/YqeY domain-containing protein [Glycomyces xiaoerkulensis]|uniref:hypothetical protein n=1 Tax=Glycomyces xiaoerkulensis TaxID=2038139 RepID=UPI0012FFD7A9|nr:hypothetical protein [Glycomyces xiaoerkulensis]
MSVRQALKQDLKQAVKDRDRTAASTLKSALAAIDNAEAVAAVEADPDRPMGEAGLGGDVARRELGEDGIAAVLRSEVAELRAALAEYERLGKAGKTAELRAALQVLGRYTAV